MDWSLILLVLVVWALFFNKDRQSCGSVYRSAVGRWMKSAWTVSDSWSSCPEECVTD